MLPISNGVLWARNSSKPNSVPDPCTYQLRGQVESWSEVVVDVRLGLGCLEIHGSLADSEEPKNWLVDGRLESERWWWWWQWREWISCYLYILFCVLSGILKLRVSDFLCSTTLLLLSPFGVWKLRESFAVCICPISLQAMYLLTEYLFPENRYYFHIAICW